MVAIVVINCLTTEVTVTAVVVVEVVAVVVVVLVRTCSRSSALV